jgi:hypothetical protein
MQRSLRRTFNTKHKRLIIGKAQTVKHNQTYLDYNRDS